MAIDMASRILSVSDREVGQTILAWLCHRLHLSRGAAEQLLRSRRIRLNGSLCSNPQWRLRRGQRVEVPTDRPNELKKPHLRNIPRTGKPTLVYVDEQLIVVDKPAGLTTMRHAEEAAEFGQRGQRYLPATLADLLPSLIAGRGGKPGIIRAVHRLDRDTTGLVVFARTAQAERHLGQQFREHSIERRYLALVRGKAVSARIESNLVADRGDGRRGSSETGQGQRAVTHVEVLEQLGQFSLVECRLETGRTHQVRIHLGEAGTPLCGERIYDRPLHGRPLPDGSGIGRTALHAAVLGLTHPVSGERLRWTAPLPRDMAELLDRLRREARQ